MNYVNKTWIPVKIWPFVAIGVILLAGFIVWDFATHRKVQEYVATGPEIPGAGVRGATAEVAGFRQIANRLTRRIEQGDVRITVTWDSPEFFKALAAAEGAQDIKRHEILYHEYAEKFGFQSDFVFTVILDSASVDLPAYSVEKNSLLRNDKGIEVTSHQRWLQGSRSSSRHVEGVLFFPQRTEAGERLIGHLIGEHLPGEKPPIWLELVLSGLPNGQEAVFRWELSPVAQALEP